MHIEAAANLSTTKPTLTMKPNTTSHKHTPTPHSSSHVYDMHTLFQAPMAHGGPAVGWSASPAP